MLLVVRRHLITWQLSRQHLFGFHKPWWELLFAAVSWPSTLDFTSHNSSLPLTSHFTSTSASYGTIHLTCGSASRIIYITVDPSSMRLALRRDGIVACFVSQVVYMTSLSHHHNQLQRYSTHDPKSKKGLHEQNSWLLCLDQMFGVTAETRVRFGSIPPSPRIRASRNKKHVKASQAMNQQRIACVSVANQS